MAGQSASRSHRQFLVQVIADLPYYVPFPEDVPLEPSLIGADPFRLCLRSFRPPGAPESDGFDDRRGTFIRSRVSVEYPVRTVPTSEQLDEYCRKALKLTNRALLAI